MRYRVPEGWTGERDGILFFAQRLEELLFDYTLDSYKPPALNAPALCREALSLIDDIEAGVIEEANLSFVMEELSWSIGKDKIARSLLDLAPEKYISWSQGGDLKALRAKLEVMGQLLNVRRYVNRCHDFLIGAVEKNAKKEIDYCARQLITSLINADLSKSYLYKKVDAFFTSGLGGGGAADLLRFLKEDIYIVAHHFEIFMIVDDKVRVVADSVASFQLEILDDLPEDLTQFATDHGFRAAVGQTYLLVKGVEAADVDSARIDAERRISQLSELLMLFSHKASLKWDERALIKQCCLDGPRLVGRQRNAMERGYNLSRSKSAKRLNWLISNIALSRKEGSLERFLRLVELHGVSLNSPVQENQLINLWTSLESVVQGKGVRGVISGLIPTLMTNYLSRIVGRLCGDLIRWNKSKLRKIVKAVQCSDGASLNQKLMLFLALPQHAPDREQLYADLGDYHLLRFRIFQLSETFSSKNSVLKFLEMHQKKVEWHIRRIYRTRNLIVHAGERPEFLESLIESCHDYLDQIIVDIVKLSCEDTRVRTLDQAFNMLNMRYERYMGNLQAMDYAVPQTIEFMTAKSMGLRL